MIKIHNEPADHISNILDFLGNLIIRSNELEQRPHLESALKEQETFIRSYLLSWMYDFKEQINAKDQFGFYAAFTRLLVSFFSNSTANILRHPTQLTETHDKTGALCY